MADRALVARCPPWIPVGAVDGNADAAHILENFDTTMLKKRNIDKRKRISSGSSKSLLKSGDKCQIRDHPQVPQSGVGLLAGSGA